MCTHTALLNGLFKETKENAKFVSSRDGFKAILFIAQTLLETDKKSMF